MKPTLVILVVGLSPSLVGPHTPNLAKLAADGGMRPLGALTADIRGYEETLQALAEAALIRRDVLPASRVALNLLAKTDETDGRRVLTVPLTAQDGALYLGPIKLLALPPVIRAKRSTCSKLRLTCSPRWLTSGAR